MSRKPWCVFIGFDRREANAYAVARQSIRTWHKHGSIDGVVLSQLRKDGLYTRPTRMRLGRLWDDISEHEMATEFANSRFLVPELMRRYGKQPYGWALFMDCDVLVRGSLSPMFLDMDDSKAVYCVKHEYQPTMKEKMDGQVQSSYARKNWSSVMAFNCDHPANKKLTLEMVNTLPGRDLHRLCWLGDDEIGELHPKWNYLVGYTEIEEDPKIVHFTDGTPIMPGCEKVEYANEWFAELDRWAE